MLPNLKKQLHFYGGNAGIDVSIIFAIQRQMKTEKRNIHNCSVSMKTSITAVYRIATNQQYFPSVKGGFFYDHTRQLVDFFKSAYRYKGIFLDTNKFTKELIE